MKKSVFKNHFKILISLLIFSSVQAQPETYSPGEFIYDTDEYGHSTLHIIDKVDSETLVVRAFPFVGMPSKFFWTNDNMISKPVPKNTMVYFSFTSANNQKPALTEVLSKRENRLFLIDHSDQNVVSMNNVPPNDSRLFPFGLPVEPIVLYSIDGHYSMNVI